MRCGEYGYVRLLFYFVGWETLWWRCEICEIMAYNVAFLIICSIFVVQFVSQNLIRELVILWVLSIYGAVDVVRQATCDTQSQTLTNLY